VRTDPGFRELRTERLVLRRSLPRDAEAISAYRSDPAVHEHQGWSRTDPDHVRAEIEEMLRRNPGEPGWVQFTVETADEGHLVGDVGLSPRADEPGVVMLGYTIDPAEQRKGYATEAMGAVARYALDVLQADLLRAYADAGNVASVRVAEKVGLEVVERFEATDGDGAWHGVRMERRRVAG
jgi:RimJ/RimL family protein N-acetyltransferase